MALGRRSAAASGGPEHAAGAAGSGVSGDEYDAVVAVGSNIDPEANILRGLQILGEHVEVAAVSSWYRCRAVGADGRPRDDPDFVNGAIGLRSHLGRPALEAVLRDVEAACERVRGPDRFAPRTLDLDLVAYGGDVVDAPALQEAHVRVPVQEVTPGLRSPPRGPEADAASPRDLGLQRLSSGPLASWSPCRQQTL